ncbi:MAG: DNA-binding response regulator [Ancylobacter novellus]|uniref:DNA-binding response regulator n=1 Tax=Ancylobacter novellus TaxID=921 RepID=A0A2W5MEU5_ANCNO|nr:MAG: DNA-binding response regulator [Ancylobacter novellus]
MKVLIADDHWMIRASLKHAIARLNQSLETFDAASFEQAGDLLRSNPDIDLMFIDLVMPGNSEFEGLRSLRARYPDIPIAVISVYEDREHVVQAISEGVIAYIPKSAEGPELLRALTLVLNGGVYFPRDILQGGRLRGGGLPVAVEEDEASTPGTLTTREDQVLKLVGMGRSNSDIATQLALSPNTVRVHLRNISLKLKLRERADLVAYCAGQATAGRGAN